MEERFRGKGHIKWFNDVQGFGVIVDEHNGEEIFVHHSALAPGAVESLTEGQRVDFEAFESTKGIQACVVRPA